MFPLQNSLHEHDRFGKPVPAFPDHAPSQNTAGGRSHARHLTG
jgi:hypothetical protein